MKRRLGPQWAAVALVLAASAALPGCALLQRIIYGPSEEMLWANDRHNAQFLASALLGDKGYYAKDPTLNAQERAKLQSDLDILVGALIGPFSTSTARHEREGQLVPHARRYLAYVDKDSGLKDQEKRDLKDPIERWLRRIGITP